MRTLLAVAVRRVARGVLPGNVCNNRTSGGRASRQRRRAALGYCCRQWITGRGLPLSAADSGGAPKR
jgi:hypothetical protein